MTSPTVRVISESFIKPQNDRSPDAKQPIYFTPFELVFLNAKYIQMGVLLPKPSPSECQDFSINTFLDNLRHSLSATLTHFYPFAARLATRKEENPPSYVIYIDPKKNDGAKLVHAKVEATVADILTPTYVPSVIHSFFDLQKAINHDGHTLPLISLQITELIDGIFLAGSVNHIIADGVSFAHFMIVWNEIFKLKPNERDSYILSHPPIFKRWVLEGSDPVINLPYTHHDQFIEPFKLSEPQQFKERFFHFSTDSVSRLKSIANSECNTDKISSLQAVAALLWRCVTRVRNLPRDGNTVCQFVVSNRSKFNPPLPDNYFGNPIQTVRAISTVDDLLNHGLGWAALRLHEAITNHDDTAIKMWVESWLKNPEIYKMSDLFHPASIHIGSSPRFDLYSLDFGLGKPIAARNGRNNKGDGKMTMYPGREGRGSIDLEVCLLPEYMTAIECDVELMRAMAIN